MGGQVTSGPVRIRQLGTVTLQPRTTSLQSPKPPVHHSRHQTGAPSVPVQTREPPPVTLGQLGTVTTHLARLSTTRVPLSPDSAAIQPGKPHSTTTPSRGQKHPQTQYDASSNITPDTTTL